MANLKLNWSLFLWILVFVIVVQGYGFKSDKEPRTIMVANGIMTDESKLLLRPHPSDKSGYYSRALQLLESMEAAPSCNRIVANNLLSSCKGIEGSPTHQEAALDDTKSVYAAQLAMCEIASTGVAIPSECKLLTPPSDKEGLKQLSGPNAAKFGGAMKIYSRHLRQCLKALESRPQWWTSYSNSRQNTVLLCQAVRIDIERDNMIALFKSAVKTNSEADAALSEAVKNAMETLLQQEKFTSAIQAFQVKLVQDLESLNVELPSYFREMMKIIVSDSKSLLDTIMSRMRGLDSDVAKLRTEIQGSDNELTHYRKNVEKSLKQVLLDNTELTVSQAEQLLSSRALVNYVTESLAGIDKQMAALTAAQVAQVETQASILNDTIEFREFLTNFTSVVVSLQGPMEATSTIIEQMSAFIHIGAAILQWGWLIPILCIIHWFHPKYAQVAAVVIASLFLFIGSGVLAYVDATVKKIDLNSTTAYNVGLPLLLVLSTLFLGITLFVLYRRARRDELLEATIQDVGSDSHSPKSAMSEKSIRPVKA